MLLSPLGLVPKKNTGQYRLIHDLSYPKDKSVNAGIPQEFTSVKYLSFDKYAQLIRKCGKGALQPRSDVADASYPYTPRQLHISRFHH